MLVATASGDEAEHHQRNTGFRQFGKAERDPGMAAESRALSHGTFSISLPILTAHSGPAAQGSGEVRTERRPTTMRAVIINADDLGSCESTNLAIAEAHLRGVLTSASLMANGTAFDHAVQHVVQQNAGLGIGLHICLTGGRALSAPEQIPLLVDRDGRFRHGFVSLYRLTVSRRHEALSQIEHEVSMQFEHLQSRGISIDHVDSHRHVHMIPRIFPLVARLARRYGCRTIRMADEPFMSLRSMIRPREVTRLLSNLPKKLLLSTLARRNRLAVGPLGVPSRTFGILGSGKMDRRAILEALSGNSDGVIEIITHPGSGSADLPGATAAELRFLCSANRRAELQALLDPDVRDRLRACAGSASRFCDLSR